MDMPCSSASISVLFNLFVIVEPLIYFCVCNRTPHKQKFKKHELFVRKSNISLLGTSTNQQLLQKLKIKKFNDSVVLAILECIATATFWIWSSGKKNPYIKYVSSHFLTLAIEIHLVRFRLDASFTFELHCSLPSTPSLLLLFCFT